MVDGLLLPSSGRQCETDETQQDPEGTWGALPTELVQLLSARLFPDRHKAPARLACKHWAAELARGCTRLSVSGRGPPGWAQKFSELRKIKWGKACPALEESGVKTLRHLRILKLQDCEDGHLDAVPEAFPGLSSLKIRCSFHGLWLFGGFYNVTDAGLAGLGRLTGLTSLTIRFSGVTDSGLRGLVQQLRGLTHLDLKGSEALTDAGVAELGGGNLPALTALSLRSCPGVTDAGLAALASSKPPPAALSWLALGLCKRVSDAGIVELGRLPSLTSLGLDYCPTITDRGLVELGRLPALRSLNLAGCCKVTGEAVEEHLWHLADLTFF